MSTPSIRRVSFLEILGAPNAQQLIDGYAAECSIPGADPQVQMYSAMEQSRALQCFGAYIGAELVGFISVLNAPTPHRGKRVGSIESLFASPAHRNTGAGNCLLTAAEQYAHEISCEALLYTARVGSRLEKILSRRAGCKATHTVFTSWL
jgi:hypothetical protein